MWVAVLMRWQFCILSIEALPTHQLLRTPTTTTTKIPLLYIMLPRIISTITITYLVPGVLPFLHTFCDKIEQSTVQIVIDPYRTLGGCNNGEHLNIPLNSSCFLNILF